MRTQRFDRDRCNLLTACACSADRGFFESAARLAPARSPHIDTHHPRMS